MLPADYRDPQGRGYGLWKTQQPSAPLPCKLRGGGGGSENSASSFSGAHWGCPRAVFIPDLGLRDPGGQRLELKLWVRPT